MVAHDTQLNKSKSRRRDEFGCFFRLRPSQKISVDQNQLVRHPPVRDLRAIGPTSILLLISVGKAWRSRGQGVAVCVKRQKGFVWLGVARIPPPRSPEPPPLLSSFHQNNPVHSFFPFFPNNNVIRLHTHCTFATSTLSFSQSQPTRDEHTSRVRL